MVIKHGFGSTSGITLGVVFILQMVDGFKLLGLLV